MNAEVGKQVVDLKKEFLLLKEQGRKNLKPEDSWVHVNNNMMRFVQNEMKARIYGKFCYNWICIESIYLI